MGAAEIYGSESSEAVEPSHEALALTPDVVEVRRNAGLAAALGAVSSGLAIAYLARAVGGGGALDGALALVMGLLGGYWLLTFFDARTPLLVADAQGVRIRLGHNWRGLPWSAVQHMEHTPRRGLLRDGRLVVHVHNEEKLLAELDASGRRRAALSTRVHGAPFALPLGLSTRVIGAGADVGAALESVADQTGAVVVIDSEQPELSEPQPFADTDEPRSRPAWRDPRPLLASIIAKLAALSPQRRFAEDEALGTGVDGGRVEDGQPADGDLEPIVASATPSPLRESSVGRRSEVRKDLAETLPGDHDELPGRELRRPGSVSLVEDTQVWGDRVRPIARPGDVVDPIVLDDFEVEPALDPIIGPELLAARTRLGLSIDQLAGRTRIRPHVIESIEVDDFAPCGGDFYARGHLRTLARVLGVDVTPMLAAYDERYAHADINPRRVFEAELATGANGSIRSTKGGPNWSLLVAVVMAVVLCWSVARLVMDAPDELRGSAPVLNGSGGPGGTSFTSADPVPVVLSAPTSGAHVVVRDGAGKIVFKGNLAVGDVKEISAAPPVRVQSTDGAVTVALDGQAARPIGENGVAGQGTYVAP
jgi:hypothetical protein